MQYANHNSNRFMDTTDDLGQSLVNDFWTIYNKADLALDRWQDAADNGYGFITNWDEITDSVIEKFDWFCDNVLRNLVAISVYVTLLAIYGAQWVYQNYVATGKAKEHALMVVRAVVDTAKAVEATWIRYGTLDGDGPCFGGPIVAEPVVVADTATEELIEWCIQQWPCLAA